jgi:uncharacterized protein (DUF1786 family)
VGIFEHHTGEIDRSHLEQMLLKLANGTLTTPRSSIPAAMVS